jgi:hypothetical protein
LRAAAASVKLASAPSPAFGNGESGPGERGRQDWLKKLGTKPVSTAKEAAAAVQFKARIPARLENSARTGLNVKGADKSSPTPQGVVYADYGAVGVVEYGAAIGSEEFLHSQELAMEAAATRVKVNGIPAVAWSAGDYTLPQVLADLSRAGIVAGTVGKGGGYVLRRDPEELTLL